MTARIGVIGAGWWTTYAHLPALAQDERATVAGIADHDEARLTAAAERFGIERRFASAEAMLDELELDAVVIAVPHAAHYPLAKLALEHKLHVLLEKPMVVDPRHGRELVSLAREHARELIVGYPRHYNTQAALVRAALADGRVGKIEYVSCFFGAIVRELYAGRPESYREEFGYTVNAPNTGTYSDPDAGGGHAQTNVTHAAALLLWMTGLEVQRVTARTATFELDVDLADAAVLEFPDGALGSLGSTGSMLPGHEEVLEYRIFGTEGHVLFDPERGELTIHTRSGVERAHPLEKPARYPEAAPARNLVDVVLEEDINQSPPEIGLATVELIDAIHRSAATGATITLPTQPRSRT